MRKNKKKEKRKKNIGEIEKIIYKSIEKSMKTVVDHAFNELFKDWNGNGNYKIKF